MPDRGMWDLPPSDAGSTITCSGRSADWLWAYMHMPPAHVMVDPGGSPTIWHLLYYKPYW